VRPPRPRERAASLSPSRTIAPSERSQAEERLVSVCPARGGKKRPSLFGRSEDRTRLAQNIGNCPGGQDQSG
jgi:hypothetical protein